MGTPKRSDISYPSRETSSHSAPAKGMGKAIGNSAERHSDKRPDHINPVMAKITHGEIRAEGAGRVHRGTRYSTKQHNFDTDHRTHGDPGKWPVRPLVQSNASDHSHQQKRQK